MKVEYFTHNECDDDVFATILGFPDHNPGQEIWFRYVYDAEKWVFTGWSPQWECVETIDTPPVSELTREHAIEAFREYVDKFNGFKD